MRFIMTCYTIPTHKNAQTQQIKTKTVDAGYWEAEPGGPVVDGVGFVVENVSVAVEAGVSVVGDEIGDAFGF